MANFEEILEGIHSGSLLSDDADKAIVVNSRRIFEIPEGFDTVIGYAGDVNSQIITFQLPLTHDNHDLSECHNQKLKWKHLNSGAEGWSELTKTTVDKTQNCWTATWAVPLDLMAQAGNIEIGISLYDFNNEHITFSWNTSTYNGFSIGEAFSEVGSLVYDQTIPAKNEILNIVTDTRQIIAPIGYNKTIANYGDVGITKVYFYADQVIDGINLSQGKIYINIQRPDLNCRDYENIDTAVIEVGSEKVLLTWNVPEYITNGVDSNNDPISGNFTISITFESSDGSKKWTSASFNGLTIGDSLLSTEIGEGGTRLDWQEMIDQAVEKTIANDIESTLDTRYVQQNDSKGARRFYSIDRNGQQTIAVGADVDQACHSGNVAMYMNDNNGKNEPRAALVSKTPVNDYQVANKKYVDDNSCWKLVEENIVPESYAHGFMIGTYPTAAVALVIKEPCHTTVAILSSNYGLSSSDVAISNPIKLYFQGWVYIQCNDGVCTIRDFATDEIVSPYDTMYIDVYTL